MTTWLLPRRGWVIPLVVLCAVGAESSAAVAHEFRPGLLSLQALDETNTRFAMRFVVRGPDVDALPTPELPCPIESETIVPCALEGQEVGVESWTQIAGTAEVVLRLEWANGDVFTHLLRRGGAHTITIPASSIHTGAPHQTTSAVFVPYLSLGVEHILSGFDHLLFVLGLLLLVPGLRALIATITAFTIAHSITLAAASLNLVHLPQAPVEACIALSIVLLAVELSRPASAPQTLIQRHPWRVAGLFGLLHGLGFSSALAATGLPADHVPLALLSFNLGVELGQIAVVLPCVLLHHLLWTSYAQRPRTVDQVCAYVMGTLSVAWVIARVS